MKLRKQAAILLTVALLSGVAAPVLADELEEVQQQAREQQNKSAQTQEKMNSVSAKLQEIQSMQEQAEKRSKQIDEEAARTETEISTTKDVLAKAEVRLAESTKLLNRRIRDIYQNGQLSYIDVLFGASDFGDFTTRMELWKRVIKRDTDLINKVRAEKALIVQQKEELDQKLARQLELKREADENKRLIAAKKAEHNELLSKLGAEKEASDQAYNELIAMSRQIEQKYRNRGSSGSTQGAVVGSGAMSWPVHGEIIITSPFGSRTHPVFGTTRFHSGYDIAADYGDPVYAADGGVVSDAGWLGGYGKAVIIDHGNGLVTLYGHNSELLVSEGQSVRQGQQIARAGSTGYSTGPHVHFEVRRNGSPVDPGQYL